MQDSVADFGLGESITGTNDDSVLINSALEGREYTFPVTEDVAKAMNMSNRAIGRRITARIVRNTTSGTLAAGDIVLVNVTAGHAGLGSVTAKSSAGDRTCLIVDPSLGASTVADDDLFYAIVKGPSKVRQPDPAIDLSAGDQVRAGGSGELLAVDPTDLGDVQKTLGTVVKADNTAAGLVEVELAPNWV